MGSSYASSELEDVPVEGLVIPAEQTEQDFRQMEASLGCSFCKDVRYGTLTGLGELCRLVVKKFAFKVGDYWWEPSVTTVRTKVIKAIRIGRLPHIRLHRGHTLGTAKGNDILVNYDRFCNFLKKENRWALRNKVKCKGKRKIKSRKKKISWWTKLKRLFWIERFQ